VKINPHHSFYKKTHIDGGCSFWQAKSPWLGPFEIDEKKVKELTLDSLKQNALRYAQKELFSLLHSSTKYWSVLHEVKFNRVENFDRLLHFDKSYPSFKEMMEANVEHFL